jgi:hypothetical protein
VLVGLCYTRCVDSFLNFIMPDVVNDKAASPFLRHFDGWGLLILGNQPMVCIPVDNLLLIMQYRLEPTLP